MKASEQCFALIRAFEGKRNNAYQDSVGIWTIGYGHTKGVKRGQVATDEQIEQMLHDDVVTFEKSIDALKLNINQNQFDALVDFAFNLGFGNLSKSTLLKKVKANPDDKTIRNEFCKWVFAGGKKLAGLVKRRTAEADLYFDGCNN